MDGVEAEEAVEEAQGVVSSVPRHVQRRLEEDEPAHPAVDGDGLVEGQPEQPRPQPVARGGDDHEEPVGARDVAPGVRDVPGQNEG